MPRREAASRAVGQGARRAAALGRSKRSPVPWGATETAVHGGGEHANVGYHDKECTSLQVWPLLAKCMPWR
eukprot:1020974-Pyramimonas_sp.AAC.1